MHGLRDEAAAEAGRLLRILLLWLGTLPADSGRAFGRDRSVSLLRGLRHGRRFDPILTRLAWQRAHQRFGVVDADATMLAALFLPAPVRAVVWTIALIWMGMACILNARQCGRTHCRYTGPYYLAMIIPVLVIASISVSASFYAWIVLGVVIIVGSGIIWWATERAWGKFS